MHGNRLYTRIEDIDECTQGACGNLDCSNTPGGYTCVCGEGYDLTQDGSGCEAQ